MNERAREWFSTRCRVSAEYEKGIRSSYHISHSGFPSYRYEYENMTNMHQPLVSYRCLSSNSAHISFLIRNSIVFRVGFVSEDSLVAECYVVRTFFKTEMGENGMNEESHNLAPSETITSLLFYQSLAIINDDSSPQ